MDGLWHFELSDDATVLVGEVVVASGVSDSELGGGEHWRSQERDKGEERKEEEEGREV